MKCTDVFNFGLNREIFVVNFDDITNFKRKKEEQNKNAIAIADRGAALYDKFVGFVENLQAIGDSIGKSQKSYDEAMKQLKDGSGNLIGQAEKLRRLGVQGKKSLPGTIINDADTDDELIN
mgnify:CR=1 FL=1